MTPATSLYCASELQRKFPDSVAWSATSSKGKIDEVPCISFDCRDSICQRRVGSVPAGATGPSAAEPQLGLHGTRQSARKISKQGEPAGKRSRGNRCGRNSVRRALPGMPRGEGRRREKSSQPAL